MRPDAWARIPGNLFAICRDDVEDMPPLNIEHGQAFIDNIISRIDQIDFVFFDNIQALLTGDMKDEESWQQTLPWIKDLTKRSVGQAWVHHTGHDESHSYGTKTREWQLDAVALMEAIERPGTDIAFNLKFTKARERTPDNRTDFEPAVITLEKDQWAVEVAPSVKFKGKPPSPLGRKFHDALLNTLATAGRIEQRVGNWPCVTRREWEDECSRLGLTDPDSNRKSALALMSKYRRELIEKDLIACDANFVWNRAVST